MAIFKSGHRNGIHRRGSKVKSYSMNDGMKYESVSVIVTVAHKTDKAWLCRDSEGVEGWVPVSQIRSWRPDPAVVNLKDRLNGDICIEIPQWIAKEKGFEI